MFENIGGKIKVFVISVTILSIISCIVCGAAIIAFSVFGDNITGLLSRVGLDGAVLALAGGFQGPLGIVAGLVVMILGSFASWLLAFIPYGLGQLIQNTDKIVKGLDGVRAVLKDLLNRDSQNPQNPQGVPVYPNPAYYPYGYPMQYGYPAPPVQNAPVQNPVPNPAPVEVAEKPVEPAPVPENVSTEAAEPNTDNTAEPNPSKLFGSASSDASVDDIYDVIDKTIG
ncbi:MAG: hypothetical protein IKU43_00050 [Clostridia bacterium]|nr:hypothetical protein [Clostridia bacterium]